MISARLILPWLVAAVTVLTGCQGLDSPNLVRSDTDPIPVVATYSILADWVGRVGGERVEVTTLVGVGGDAHTYEPTPRDNVALANAQLIFENGIEFEGWLDKLCASSRTRAARVVVSRNITPRAHFCECHGSEQDPHVWQSIRHAIGMVEVIAEELGQHDPRFADDYRARAASYIEELTRLDEEIRQELASIPPSRRLLVTTHDSLGYFADEYGFEVFSLLDSSTSEAADPSASRLASTIRRLKEHRVPAIFGEQSLNSKLAEQVARQANMTVVASLYTDALGSTESPASDYVSMMRFNAHTIAESLR